MADKKSSGSKEGGDDALDLAATDAYGRKIWDKDAYIERAKNNIMFGPERIGRRKDPVIPLPSSQRTYLKQRGVDLELDKNLGKQQVVTQHTIKPMQGGYWCSVCECLLKDSATYLEHVNGRRHNRNLGMNMKVEKVGIDRVKEKLASMRKKTEEVVPEDITVRLAALEEEEAEKKRRRKEKKKNKAKKKGGGGGEGDDDDDDGDATGGEEEQPPAKKPKTADEEASEPEEETEEMKMLKQLGLPTGFG
mmetsp:Transcript_63626/g.186673  ORF Transcript_63626/g.186673 Transcript_63626/m.186673 type:complete len:249 (-) Transcript_63626:40-786(-)